MGRSGLDQIEDFQNFCGSGLDRIQFYRNRTGLGLKNFTVRSSLLSVSESYPKVYYDAQHIFLCFVYFAFS